MESTFTQIDVATRAVAVARIVALFFLFVVPAIVPLVELISRHKRQPSHREVLLGQPIFRFFFPPVSFPFLPFSLAVLLLPVTGTRCPLPGTVFAG